MRSEATKRCEYSSAERRQADKDARTTATRFARRRDRKRDKPDIPELDDTAPVRKIPARENRTNVSFRGKGHPLDKGKALGLGNSLFM